MRVKIPRWEIAVICSALLFPGTSLSAQEVGQEEKEVKEMRQDVEQLQRTSANFVKKCGDCRKKFMASGTTASRNAEPTP